MTPSLGVAEPMLKRRLALNLVVWLLFGAGVGLVWLLDAVFHIFGS